MFKEIFKAIADLIIDAPTRHTDLRYDKPKEVNTWRNEFTENAEARHKEQKTVQQEQYTQEWSEAKWLGEMGENRLRYEIEDVAKGTRQLQNLYLYKRDGSTTEIDCVVICTKGAIVIEVKNYGGNIYGNSEQERWQHFYNSPKAYTFYNPVRQNNGHIQTIRYNLGSKTPCFSMILFADRCRLHITNNEPYTYIGHISDASDIMRSLLNCESPEYWTKERVEEVADFLISKQATESDKANHTQHIKEQQSKCPKCGQTLKIRMNKTTGNFFWACPGFPNCRYTKPID